MALFSQLGNYRNFGLFVMRAGLGVMMFMHGINKLTAGPAEWKSLGESMGYLHIHFMPVFWGFMSVVTETIGGLFCVLGLWFRLVSILMVINFTVAALASYAEAHKIMDASHAIELAFVFFGLIFIGAGEWSVDRS
jgi:putative oxidoreductase